MARITWQLFLVGCVFLQSYTQAQPLERIVNGKFAQAKQFPYQVYLRSYISNFKYSECGGAIISDRLILTAAHCVIDSIKVEIYFGAVNINNIYEVGQQRISVEPKTNIRIHGLYQGPEYGQVINDIALIKLPRRLIFDEYIQPAKLPEPNNDYSNRLDFSSGWGTIDKMNGGTPPVQLMYYVSRILSPYKCRKRLLSVQASWICSMSYKSTTCSGDSGGAVVVTNLDRSVTLVGLTSFGYNDRNSNCLPGHFPSVATRVSYYLDWIKRTDNLMN